MGVRSQPTGADGHLSRKGALLGATHLSSCQTTKTAKCPGYIKGVKDKENQLVWSWSGEVGKITPNNLRKMIWKGDEPVRYDS